MNKKAFITIWGQLFNVHHITHIIKCSLNDKPGIRISCISSATCTPNERFFPSIDERDMEFDNLTQLLSKFEY